MPSQQFTPSGSQRSNGTWSESIYRSPQKRKEILRNAFINAQALRKYNFLSILSFGTKYNFYLRQKLALLKLFFSKYEISSANLQRNFSYTAAKLLNDFW